MVDASVLVDALTGKGDVGERARLGMKDHRWFAPETLRVETFSSIRGRVLGGKIPAATGLRAARQVATLGLEVVPTTLLIDRMWALRDNLSAYDAAYVAAAEHLGIPLLTADRKLASAPGLRCEIRTP